MQGPLSTLSPKTIDFRRFPQLYQIGRGEEGVLTVEPYKSELLPLWRFKTPEIAGKSAKQIFQMFVQYRRDNDFVGMDTARKYLQMGWTRARRYANHRSGRKWNDDRTQELPHVPDPEKSESARIFFEMFQRAKNDPVYIVRKAQHRRLYG